MHAAFSADETMLTSRRESRIAMGTGTVTQTLVAETLVAMTVVTIELPTGCAGKRYTSNHRLRKYHSVARKPTNNINTGQLS